MSFIPAVRREINTRRSRDPVRLTLDFLLQRAVGRGHAVTLANIVKHLRFAGVSVTPTQFQQTILAESRDRDYFIGSNQAGYFLIDTIDDARAMRDFYEERIRAEQQNLDNLRRQAATVGWGI
jgi:hypothetical protein